MKENVEEKYTVGQKLAFDIGRGNSQWQIHEITKITPSGRLICGHYTLNPDLTIRGTDVWSPCYSGRVITDKIKEKYEHQQLTLYLNSLNFKQFDLTTLKAVNFLLPNKENK